jgi:murein DD-endopeptidase MepM/ murein hydrolase activator NlpD
MARRLTLCLVLLVVLALAPAASAGPGERKQVVDDHIRRLHEKIASARAQEGVLSSQISAYTDKIRALEDDVGRASDRLSTLERDLALHQAKLDRLTALFRLQTNRLEFLRAQYEAALARLNARLVAIYEADRPDTMAVLLSASSLGDLIDQLDYLSQIGTQDHTIASQVADAKAQVTEARAETKKTRAGVAVVTRAIAVRTDEQRRVRDQLLASQNALDSARHEKQRSLASIKSDEREWIDEVDALSQVSASLAARIRSAQATAPTSVPSSSGLIWPVAGPVTSPFGMRWGRMHEGIDIGAAYGTPIHAAASGTIIYAGWLGGYGNLVVIDHGGGLATAYGHQSAIAVGSGQQVTQGQTIGYVGCTGHCFGPHLHFEVRVNGAAVDPLGYL